MSEPLAYLTVAGPTQAAIEVRRSRFVCELDRVEDEDAARAAIEQVRSTSRDARHHCTAFILGPDGATRRSNDDGEPTGTAGAPMLAVLRGAELTNVLAVVTRWFGGVLLGTGGLIRAYGEAVQSAVAAAHLVRVELREVLTIVVGPAEAARVENAIRDAGLPVTAQWSAEAVHLRTAVAPDAVDALRTTVARLTSGRVELAMAGPTWVDQPP
ncbi:MAG: IMPACT family protein [Micrococcales bacterium]|nr:IMPACT family protein [Micrococcales bacterium]